ncbi:MAG: hypothetical protein GX555_07035, partial [Actinomycetales bacterium]|nr:hypothetical protein [Actinomycetales bacterium]
MTETRGRSRTAAALAVCLAAALTACTGAPAATPPAVDEAVVVTQDAEATASGPITPEDALALGEHLTEALASGDVEAWLERTDLDESAEQQQRDWFAGVQAVPMDLREMHPTFLVRVDDGAGGALVRYAFRHQVTGVDAVPVIEL